METKRLAVFHLSLEEKIQQCLEIKALTAENNEHTERLIENEGQIQPNETHQLFCLAVSKSHSR